MKKIIALSICLILSVSLLGGCGKKVESIEVAAPQEMDIGATHQLEVTVLPEDAGDKALTYTSSDEAVATVDEAGNVTAVAKGEAVITIQSSNKEVAYTFDLSVIQPVTKLEADVDMTITYIGSTQQYAVTVFPADATHKEITYTSSDETVATIDENGVITTYAKGNVVIAATAHNGVSVSQSLRVQVPVEAVTLDKESAALTVGETTQLVATISPLDAEFDIDLIWSSSDEAVATVDEAGNVTAVAKGEAVITAANAGGINASATITVSTKRASGSGTTTSGSGSKGSSGGNTSSGSSGTGGSGSSGGGSSTPSDETVQSVVSAARSYAQSLGFTVIGGLQYSWSVPTAIAGSYDWMLSNVKENVYSEYEYEIQLYGEFTPGSTLSIEYIVNGPGGTGIYVSY